MGRRVVLSGTRQPAEGCALWISEVVRNLAGRS